MTRRTNRVSTTNEKCAAVLNGQQVMFTLRRSARARRLRLEVRPETGLIAVVPRRYDVRDLEKFMAEKADWVLKNLAKCQQARRPAADGELRSGDRIPYLGKEMKIAVQLSWHGSGVKLKGEHLLVSLGSGNDGLSPMLQEWYRTRAGELFKQRADELSGRLGLKYNRVLIRGQKTRWGSCSHKCNLSFNWRLIMAPRPVIDYVVLHELAHLREMNHTKRFWKLLAEFCPRWRQHRKWLKDHGPELALVLSV